MLIALYDLALCPVSFDFIHFLIAAQEQAGEDPLHVVIIPGERENEHKPISEAERQWRVQHVFLPLCHSIGATVTVWPDRKRPFQTMPGDRAFPDGYGGGGKLRAYYLSTALEAIQRGAKPRFRPSERAREHVAKWLGPAKRLVTITLRDTHTAIRNSNVEVWREVAYLLKRRGWFPVFIPDTAQMAERKDRTLDLDPAAGVYRPTEDEFPLASCDLDLRLALYDAAAMNLSSSGGPFMLNVFDEKRPFLFFLRLFDGPFARDQRGKAHWLPSRQYMELMGLPEGAQFPFSAPNRRVVWAGDDDPEVILGEFDRAVSAELVS